MHLSKRGRGSCLALEQAKYFIDWFAQFALNDGARAQKLAELNHQYTQLNRRLAKRHQHFDQHLNIRSYVVLAALMSTNDPLAFAINNPEGPEEQAKYAPCSPPFSPPGKAHTL